MKHRLLPSVVPVKRFSLIAGLAAIVALATTSSASAGFGQIGVNDNFFDPDRVTTAEPNQCFTWAWGTVGNPHNVRQDRKLFYSGAPTSADDFEFDRCASAGKFPYFCEVHGSRSGGMDGVVRVRPVTEPSQPDEIRVRWAQDFTNTGNRFDVRYRVEDGNWHDWKTNTRRRAGNFGRNDNPRDVKLTKTYFFKVRSQKGTNDDKVSGWSPRLRVDLSI